MPISFPFRPSGKSRLHLRSSTSHSLQPTPCQTPTRLTSGPMQGCPDWGVRGGVGMLEQRQKVSGVSRCTQDSGPNKKLRYRDLASNDAHITPATVSPAPIGLTHFSRVGILNVVVSTASVPAAGSPRLKRYADDGPSVKAWEWSCTSKASCLYTFCTLSC